MDRQFAGRGCEGEKAPESDWLVLYINSCTTFCGDLGELASFKLLFFEI